jgi:hypothetical protein
MALQFSTTVRNNQLNQFQSTIGASAVLKIWAGTLPAACSAADTGNTTLVSFGLGATWANTASGGLVSWANLPITATAAATGTASYFRLYASDGVTCHMQGIVTVTGGGGDVTFDTTAITAGQSISITSWTWTAPGA